jgi:hypothetical protein
MRSKDNSDIYDTGLSEERLGLVHRYMVDAPDAPPPKPQRWSPAGRETAGRVAAARRVVRRPEPAAVPASQPEPSPVLEAVPVLEPARAPEPSPALDAVPVPEPAPEPVRASVTRLRPVPDADAELSVSPEAPAAAFEPEEVDAQDDSGTTGLPIDLWVGASAEDSPPNPDWPQELLRLGLERSRRRDLNGDEPSF